MPSTQSPTLDRRQRETVEALLGTASQEEASLVLGVTPAGMRRRLEKLRQALRVRTTTDAVIRALQLGEAEVHRLDRSAK